MHLQLLSALLFLALAATMSSASPTPIHLPSGFVLDPATAPAPPLALAGPGPAASSSGSHGFSALFPGHRPNAAPKGIYVVQLRKGTKAPARAALQADAKVALTYPLGGGSHAYLVYADERAAEKLRGADAVEYIGPLGAGLKAAPSREAAAAAAARREATAAGAPVKVNVVMARALDDGAEAAEDAVKRWRKEDVFAGVKMEAKSARLVEVEVADAARDKVMARLREDLEVLQLEIKNTMVALAGN